MFHGLVMVRLPFMALTFVILAMDLRGLVNQMIWLKVWLSSRR
jgi:hypothetical protein